VVKLAGIATVIYVISRFAKRIETLFELILRHTTHWRMHLLVLLILVVVRAGPTARPGGNQDRVYSRPFHESHPPRRPTAGRLHCTDPPTVFDPDFLLRAGCN
jgi:hypothetical protein